MSPAPRKAPELPAVIHSEALEQFDLPGVGTIARQVARALQWIPFYPDVIQRETARFTDFQCGWYFRLYLGCCCSPIPGLLRVRSGQGNCAGNSASASDLWISAGAHSERAFEKRSSAVLAAFRVAEVDGKRYLYHPHLLETILEQIGKLKLDKRRGHDSHISSFSTSGEQLPLLLFQVLRKEKAQEQSSARSAPQTQDDSEEMWAFRVRQQLRTQGRVTGELAEWAERLGIRTEARKKKAAT